MKIKIVFLCAALSAALLFSIASCRAGEVNEPQSVKKSESLTAAVPATISEETFIGYSEKSEQKSSAAANQTAKNNETTIVLTDKAAEKPNLLQSDKRAESTASIAEEEKSETQTTSVISKTETVKVTVDCRHALEYQSAHPEKEIFIPQNSGGIICTGELNPEHGDTALSVLKKELEASGFSLRESHGYVSGIGELNEKACGGASGWMFTVNGELPFASSDEIAVNPGDEVVFYYVVNYGESF